MKRIIGLVVSGLAVSGLLTAQTLNVQVGNVRYMFPAEQTDQMPYDNGETLTVMGKAFALSEIDNMFVDETKVTDSSVKIAYDGTSAAITVAGNVAKDLTITSSGAHVKIEQSADLAEEITYTLSGATSDGGFYTSGSYKATVELNNLTLTNVSAVYSGSAIHVQNSKRIKIKPLNGTTNTLVDAASGSKGCLYIKGHAEFAQKGTLNITGNVKHGIKCGEYFQIKNSTINILSAAGDGINCGQFFLMESGTINISGVADDGIQCDIEDTTVGSTGETADHEDEDSGNVYISGGSITATVTADACKGLKSEGDLFITGGTITISTSGGGVWDATNLKTKSASCISADGNMAISGGTLTLTSTGAGGKGLSGDGNLNVSGSAVITVVTSGQAVVASSTGTLSIVSDSQTLDRYDSDYKSSPKGIKIDGDIVIDGGTISVTTSGAGGEGIESKNILTINDGHITVEAFDDGINCSSDMYINGGYIYVKGSKNDAMDANGNMYVSGGLIFAIGATSPEVALDANTEQGKKLYITGGTIIAAGNLEGGAQISGGTCKYTTSWYANQWYALYNGGNLVALFYTPTKSSSGGFGIVSAGPPGGGGGGSQKLVVYTSSTPTLQGPSTDKVSTSVSDVSGEYFGGKLYLSGTLTNGSNISLSNYSSGGW